MQCEPRGYIIKQMEAVMDTNLLNTIQTLGIVPVIVINNADHAENLAKALLEGGIPCIEVTFRTAAAEESIKRIHAAYPQMLIGAGTIISIEQAQKALNAGAKFIVSPGFDEKLVSWCLENDIPVFPGVSTASEVQVAVSMGLSTLKFFPAEASGGVNMIKNLCGPFPNVKFMTTGGISLSNLSQYASCPHVVAVGGSWMAKSSMIENQEWDKITALCKEAVKASMGFELIHFGINNDSFEKAQEASKLFNAFGMQTNVGNSSTFMNTTIELMHTNFKGAKGHIGYKCYSIERAIEFLKPYGFTPDMSSAKYNEKNQLKVIYFNEEISGFAVHLVRA